MIVLIVPTKYKIFDVQLHANNDINITNFVNYYKKSNTNDIVINKLNSDAYIIYFSSGVHNQSILHIHLTTTNNTYASIYNNSNNRLILRDSTNILNGDYVSSYWIDTDKQLTKKNNQLASINTVQYNAL